MLNMFQYDELLDYHEQHHDFFVLANEYSGTEIFKEIILFMYEAFPEWTSNRGIGEASAEFVLTAIQNLDYVYDDDDCDYDSRQSLETIFLSLPEYYKRTKEWYEMKFKIRVVEDFGREFDEILSEKEHLPRNDFNAFYDELLSNYESKRLDEITYDFRF